MTLEIKDTAIPIEGNLDVAYYSFALWRVHGIATHVFPTRVAAVAASRETLPDADPDSTVARLGFIDVVHRP